MQTLDEQLDAALTEKRDLETKLADAKGLMDEALKENETLTAANKELKEQAQHTAEKLTKLEADHKVATDQVTQLQADHQAATDEVEKLKAEAKSAEERAAEYYGAGNPKPAPATPKGEPKTQPVAEQLAGISDPAKQTALWRGLSEEQQAELLAAQ